MWYQGTACSCPGAACMDNRSRARSPWPTAVLLWHGFITGHHRSRHLQEALRASEAFAKSTLDAAAAQICVLDAEGASSRSTNPGATSTRNADGNPVPDFSRGWHYLSTCDRARSADSEEASAMAQRHPQVMRGERTQFDLEYPCHSPTESRWFLARSRAFTTAAATSSWWRTRTSPTASVPSCARRHRNPWCCSWWPTASRWLNLLHGDHARRGSGTQGKRCAAASCCSTRPGRRLHPGASPSLPTSTTRRWTGWPSGPAWAPAAPRAYRPAHHRRRHGQPTLVGALPRTGTARRAALLLVTADPLGAGTGAGHVRDLPPRPGEPTPADLG